MRFHVHILNGTVTDVIANFYKQDWIVCYLLSFLVPIEMMGEVDAAKC